MMTEPKSVNRALLDKVVMLKVAGAYMWRSADTGRGSRHLPDEAADDGFRADQRAIRAEWDYYTDAEWDALVSQTVTLIGG